LWDLWFETQRLWYGIDLSSELTSVQWVYNTGLPRFNTFLKEQISAQLRNKREIQSQIDEGEKAKQEKSHEQEKKIILKNILIKEAIAKELQVSYKQEQQVITQLEREHVKNLESEKNIFSQIKNKRIAHAWWAYRGKSYTNSLQALNANKAAYEIFEIDLSWTADGKLVCIHDWLWGPENHLWIYDTNNTVLNYKEFNTLARWYKDYTACNLESLISWFKDNPGTFLVPDIKEKNVEALRVISEKYPEMQDRIIAQIYQPNEYQQIWDMWYKNIIWTTYKYTGTNKKILLELTKMDVVALAMDTTRMGNGLAQMASNAWYYTYVHTLNTTEELQIAQKAWADEIMTDFLKQ
jgi:glycerophosphoryl diester phosphodiesterase